MAKLKIEFTHLFEKELKALNKKYPFIIEDLWILNISLMKDPDKGEPLGKDCYKIRLKISSKVKGKSSGPRIIICVKLIKDTIFLISIYDKSERQNITSKELIVILKQAGLS